MKLIWQKHHIVDCNDHRGQNNNIVDKNRTLYTKLKNKMIEQKLLLLTCLGENPRRRSTVTIKPYLYLHNCALIRPANLKQIFHIFISVRAQKLRWAVPQVCKQGLTGALKDLVCWMHPSWRQKWQYYLSVLKKFLYIRRANNAHQNKVIFFYKRWIIFIFWWWNHWNKRIVIIKEERTRR